MRVSISDGAKKTRHWRPHSKSRYMTYSTRPTTTITIKQRISNRPALEQNKQDALRSPTHTGLTTVHEHPACARELLATVAHWMQAANGWVQLLASRARLVGDAMVGLKRAHPTAAQAKSEYRLSQEIREGVATHSALWLRVTMYGTNRTITLTLTLSQSD